MAYQKPLNLQHRDAVEAELNPIMSTLADALARYKGRFSSLGNGPVGILLDQDSQLVLEVADEENDHLTRLVYSLFDREPYDQWVNALAGKYVYGGSDLEGNRRCFRTLSDEAFMPLTFCSFTRQGLEKAVQTILHHIDYHAGIEGFEVEPVLEDVQRKITEQAEKAIAAHDNAVIGKPFALQLAL